jgi:hypothetical protein
VKLCINDSDFDRLPSVMRCGVDNQPGGLGYLAAWYLRRRARHSSETGSGGPAGPDSSVQPQWTVSMPHALSCAADAACEAADERHQAAAAALFRR